jgi:hypothetical protein
VNDRVGLWKLIFNEKESEVGQEFKEQFDITSAEIGDEYDLDVGNGPILDNDSSSENSKYGT